MSEACLRLAWPLLDFDEGNRLFPYRCTAHKMTIGRGRNLEARGISQVESDLMTLNDLAQTIAFLEKTVPTWPELSPLRQAVLVDMVHALGEGGFLAFRQTRAALEARNFPRAAFEIGDSTWVAQLQKLRKRGDYRLTRPERLAEMFRTNQWLPDIPTSTPPPLSSTLANIGTKSASVFASPKNEPKPLAAGSKTKENDYGTL